MKRHGEVERLVRVGLRARHLLGEGQRAVEPARVRERERVGLFGRLDAAGAVALRGRAAVRRLLDGRLVSVRVGFPHGVGGAHWQPAYGDGLAGCEEQRRAALQGEVAVLVGRGGAGGICASRAAAQRQRVGEVARKRRAVRVRQLHCEREGARGLGAVARHLLRQRERARLLRVGERRLGARVGRDGAACHVAVRALVVALASVSPLARLRLTLVCTPRFARRRFRPSRRPRAASRAVRVANRLAARLRLHDDRRLEAARSASSSSTVKRVFSGRSASVRDCPSARLTCADPCASSVRSPLSAPPAPCKATAPESGEPASSASVMRKANSRARSAAVIGEDVPPAASVFDTASEPVFCAGASVSTPLLPRRAVSSVRSAAWYSETEMVFT